MIHGRKALHVAALLVSSFWGASAHSQESEAASCAEKMTDQLRRFSEKCLADVVAYVASQPKMAARIASEGEKFYVLVIRDKDGMRAEAVSKFNYPLMKEGTANALKQLGWQAPENESDNWRKRLGDDRAQPGAVAEDLAKALAAYGLQRGQAITLTVGPDISG